jgi:hypothetical protein
MQLCSILMTIALDNFDVGMSTKMAMEFCTSTDIDNDNDGQHNAVVMSGATTSDTNGDHFLCSFLMPAGCHHHCHFHLATTHCQMVDATLRQFQKDL